MPRSMKLLGLTFIAAVIAVMVFTAIKLTFFVVQPIGALPNGVTAVIWRLNSMKFVDSPDAWCERQTGGVNLLCRGAVIAKVARQDVIIARLPYSDTLYRWSTDGHRYDR